MVYHWKLDSRIDKTVLFLRDFHWSQQDLSIIYHDEFDKICIQLLFPVTVELFQIKFVEKSLYSNDDIYSLYSAASCEGPINPFFYQTLSIEEINAFVLYIGSDGRHLTKYTMTDHDTWVTVISSVPPQVVITDIILL